MQFDAAWQAVLAAIDAGRFAAALDPAQRWAAAGADLAGHRLPGRDSGPRFDARWWLAWGVLSQAAGWNARAEEYAQWAMNDDPQLGFTHYLRAQALLRSYGANYRRRAAGEALIELDEALRLGFEDSVVYAAQAELLLAREQYAAAAAAHEALALDPENLPARRTHVRSLVLAGRAAEAHQELVDLPAETLTTPEFVELRGWVALHQGSYAEAEQAFGAALERRPDDPQLRAQRMEAIKARAWIYRPLLRKDLWLERCGARGARVRSLAAWGPLWAGLLGLTVLIVLAGSQWLTTQQMAVGALGLIGVCFLVSICVGSSSTSNFALSFYFALPVYHHRWREPLLLFEATEPTDETRHGIFFTLLLVAILSIVALFGLEAVGYAVLLVQWMLTLVVALQSAFVTPATHIRRLWAVAGLLFVVILGMSLASKDNPDPHGVELCGGVSVFAIGAAALSYPRRRAMLFCLGCAVSAALCAVGTWCGCSPLVIALLVLPGAVFMAVSLAEATLRRPAPG